MLFSAGYIFPINQRTFSELDEDKFGEFELLSLENYQ